MTLSTELILTLALTGTSLMVAYGLTRALRSLGEDQAPGDIDAVVHAAPVHHLHNMLGRPEDRR